MKLRSNNNGTIYIMVVFIASIILTLIGTLLTITAAEVRLSKAYSDGIKAYYIAESGIEKAKAYILGQSLPVDGTVFEDKKSYIKSENSSVNFFSYDKNYSINIAITYDTVGSVYIITSEAMYNNKVKRKIEVSIKKDDNGTPLVQSDDKIMIQQWKQTKPI